MTAEIRETWGEKTSKVALPFAFPAPPPGSHLICTLFSTPLYVRSRRHSISFGVGGRHRCSPATVAWSVGGAARSVQEGGSSTVSRAAAALSRLVEEEGPPGKRRPLLARGRAESALPLAYLVAAGKERSSFALPSPTSVSEAAGRERIPSPSLPFPSHAVKNCQKNLPKI